MNLAPVSSGQVHMHKPIHRSVSTRLDAHNIHLQDGIHMGAQYPGMPDRAQSNSSDRVKKPVIASATYLRCRGVCTLLGNRPLPQMVMRSLVQVSWLPSFLLTRLPMGTPQWRCERSYSAQLREQRPNGTSLDQRGCVQKRKKRSLYTKRSDSVSRLVA
jgi:hypothetical protein